METSYDLITAHCLKINKTEDIFENTILKNKNINFTFLVYLFVLLILCYQPSLTIQKKHLRLFIYLCSLLISIILLPLLLGLTLTFLIYRQTIKLVLKITTGKKFEGLLDGNDSVWAIGDESKCIINILMIVESKDDFQKFYNHIRQFLNDNIFKEPLRFPKLLTTFKQAFGYLYLIKSDVMVDDYVRLLEFPVREKEIDKNKLMEVLSEFINQDLPNSHLGTAFWEILVGNRRVIWNDDNKRFYPIIFRIHHSLGDGVSLLRILMEILADNSTQIFELRKCYIEQKTEVFGKLSIYTKNIFVMLSTVPHIFLQILRHRDCNSLHGPKLSGQKIVTVKVEDDRFGIDTIMKIKSHFVKTTFTDILLSAVSVSFREYYEKHSVNIPNFLTTVVSVYPKSSTSSPNLHMGNRFSVAMLNLPISRDVKPYFINTLPMVQKETKRLKNSNDFKRNYWLLSIASTLLPVPLLKPLIKSTQSTLILSNLPEPSSVNIFDGCKLEDLMFWVPHRGTTGVGISVLSYDGRLQLGISVDKALISDQSDVQEIVDGIYKNLILMYDEIVEERKGVK